MRYPIPIVLFLARLKHYFNLLTAAASRVSVLRVGLIAWEAGQFRWGASDAKASSRRTIVELVDTGAATLNLSSIRIAKAEQAADALDISELWYEISIPRDSRTIECLHELFPLVYLSSRARYFSIAFSKSPGLPAAGFERMGGLDVDDGTQSHSHAAYLSELSSLDRVLGKPFYQSEIAPSDYLKRASNGRKVVLVSLTETVFPACWRSISQGARALFAAPRESLFFIVDGAVALPDAASDLAVQPLRLLGFTALEQLALARNVDYLITDRAPYVLAAAARNVQVLIPQSPAGYGAELREQEIVFKVARRADPASRIGSRLS